MRTSMLLGLSVALTLSCGDDERSPGPKGAGATGGSTSGGSAGTTNGGSGNAGSNSGGSTNGGSAGSSNGGSAGSAGTGSGGSSAGGSSAGGSAAGGSAGGGAAGSSSGGAGNAGSAGTSSTGGNGGFGNGPCIGNKAWGLTITSTPSPTPSGLATAFSQIAPAGTTLAGVLHIRGATGPRMATSAIGVVSGISDLFWTPSAPSFASVSVASTSFSYQAPQATGTMRVSDDNGEQFIALTQINLSMGTSTDANCDSISASVSARIPQSEGSKSLTISGDTNTLGTLAGASSAGGWDIALEVTGQSVAFSFDDI